MIRNISRSKDIELSATCEINLDVLNRIIGTDTTNSNDAWEFHYTKLVQRRKHKKYRINKKWAKRYGFREETYNMGNYHIDSVEKNGDITTYNMIRKGEN